MIFAVNSKSGRAALVVQGLTTTNDDDRLIPAVRLIRPEKRSIASLKGFEEFGVGGRRRSGLARGLGRRDRRRPTRGCSRELVLVSGLLLPIWSSLPDKATSVRRLKAPDGRRWLGRVLDPGQVPQLKIALGLTDTASAFGDGAAAAPLVLQEGAALVAGGRPVAAAGQGDGPLPASRWSGRPRSARRSRRSAASSRSSPTRRGCSCRRTSPRC